jgi:hypothetical protein
MTVATVNKSEKQQTALQALDENAAMSITLGRRQEQIRDQIAGVGARGTPPTPGANGQPGTSGHPATGQVKALLSQIVDAHAAAARGGKAANVGDLERQITDLEQRRQQLLLEHAGVRQEAERVTAERVTILHERCEELGQLLLVAVEDGNEQLATLRAAATDAEAARGRVRQLLTLAAGGLDSDGRRKLVAATTPFAIPTDPATGAIATRYRPLSDYWISVSKVASPPLAPPQ